jgi:hypothetical protein
LPKKSVEITTSRFSHEHGTRDKGEGTGDKRQWTTEMDTDMNTDGDIDPDKDAMLTGTHILAGTLTLTGTLILTGALTLIGTLTLTLVGTLTQTGTGTPTGTRTMDMDMYKCNFNRQLKKKALKQLSKTLENYILSADVIFKFTNKCPSTKLTF